MNRFPFLAALVAAVLLTWMLADVRSGEQPAEPAAKPAPATLDDVVARLDKLEKRIEEIEFKLGPPIPAPVTMQRMWNDLRDLDNEVRRATDGVSRLENEVRRLERDR